MNKKGFTLVELLGVIVILAIVLGIAIPSASNYIQRSRREAFVAVVREYVDAVQKGMASEEFLPPVDRNNILIVSMDLIPLDKGKKESSYQAEWVKSKSYVVVINTGSADEVQYEYFVAAQDKKNNALPLMNIVDVRSSEIISDAKNKMEVTIQSLCGSETGKKVTLSTIKGLENFQPTDRDGNEIDWDGIIYSSSNCAS